MGGWQQEQPTQEEDDQYEMDYGYRDEASEAADLADDEVVSGSEVGDNNERLREYVERIREIAASVEKQVATEQGECPAQPPMRTDGKLHWKNSVVDAI